MPPISSFFARWVVNRILSSYWLAHFYLMKKSATVFHYFGLHCVMYVGFIQLFYSRAVIQRTIVDSLTLLEITVNAHTIRLLLRSRRIRDIYSYCYCMNKAARNSELFSNIQDHDLPGLSYLAGRYL